MFMLIDIIASLIDEQNRDMFSRDLSITAKPSGKMFDSNSTSKIASPISMLNISVRVEIVSFSRVSLSLLVNLGQVIAWS
jgi:hypothetical protein